MRFSRKTGKETVKMAEVRKQSLKKQIERIVNSFVKEASLTRILEYVECVRKEDLNPGEFIKIGEQEMEGVNLPLWFPSGELG